MTPFPNPVKKEVAPMSIGTKIARKMKRAGLTQGALAAKAGLHQSTISRIVTGKHADPRGGTIFLIARAFDTTVAKLRRGTA